MKSFLSGMPELKLGLNDKLMFEATGRGHTQPNMDTHITFIHIHILIPIGRSTSRIKAVELEDIKFHQCVRLARFENDRTISFIPPDGEFELMSYRLNTQVRLVCMGVYVFGGIYMCIYAVCVCIRVLCNGVCRVWRSD